MVVLAISLMFATKPSFPLRWKSVQTGSTRTIKVTGDHVRIDNVLPDDAKGDGDFSYGELDKHGDHYTGFYFERSTCEYDSGRKACDLKTPVEITVLRPDRIEGSAQYPRTETFDCEKCTFAAERQKITFTWVPEK
jgi:hypothetical protein